jgi:acetyl-CoA/propionyl-CoA carboxylase biotin carboxyl carrier protein
VTVYEEPGGPGVRVDSSLRGPGLVAESYDPLFAKLIVRGADREEALSRLGRALAEFGVEGIYTTLPFFRAILSDEAFVSGDYSTGFVAERMGLLEMEPTPPAEPATDRERSTREVEVEVNGKLFRVKVFGEENSRSPVGPPRRRQGDTRRASASGGAIAAPMQGTIVRVLVEVGQKVEADEPVCILEAMKMESEVRSQKSGTVSEVRVESGQTVRSGDPLVLVE